MKENFPRHVAVIPDGNRRWARRAGLNPHDGHREGFSRFREVSDEAFRMDIPHFTFWAASEDNLIKRGRLEVRFLVSLLKKELERELKSGDLIKNKISIRVIGQWNEILKDEKLKKIIHSLEEKTSQFNERRLTVLFGYDGQREMLEAVKKCAGQNGIDHGVLKSALWTAHLPEVDLVIRTGGEPHWSAGFMMWHTANAQLYFTEKFWPDFTEKEFKKALADYAGRERRFGR